MPRVVLACDWFVKYVCEQAAALARAGADVVLLLRDHAFEFDGSHAEREETIAPARSAGVRIVTLRGRGRDLGAISSLRSIRKELACFAPDVVHVHEGVDPRVFTVLPPAPIVLTVHDLAPHPGTPMHPNLLKRWVQAGAKAAWRNRASLIIVHSDALRGRFRARNSQQLAVVPHGLSPHFEPLPPPVAPLVGFFGRLDPYKGLDVLARAMPRVWRGRPDVRLRVVGTGPSMLPLSDPRVSFERVYLPESEIESFFRSTSLAVLPYIEASQSGVGSTAIGFGVPVIASRVGGLHELVLDDSYLTQAGDDAALAAAIVRHIDDGPAVRTRVLREIAAPRSWDATAVTTMQLYRKLADR
jgi:glycosyltransferase involved in cell wall biosynthesis